MTETIILTIIVCITVITVFAICVFAPSKDKQSQRLEDINYEDIMSNKKETVREIPAELYERLDRLGMLSNDVSDHNQGASDYSRRLIQP